MRSSQLATGAARRVDLDGPHGPLAALQAGDTSDPAVLLVPGFTGSKEDFGPLLNPLAEAGLFATAIDLPGQFESPGPDHPAGYAVPELADVVRRAAAQLPGPVHLLGHSFGGLVSRRAVIDEPDAFASLVLMSSGPAGIVGERRERVAFLAPLLEQGGLAGLYAAMQAAAAADPGYVPGDPEVMAFLERRFLASSPVMLEGMAQALTAEPDHVADLAATGAPVLVVYGEHDDAWPPALQAEMARRLGIEPVVIPDAAHSPAIENPAPTIAALRSFWMTSA